NRGPDVVAPGLPVFKPGIDGDRKLQAASRSLPADALDNFLPLRFRRVDADDRQALAAEVFAPTLVPRVVLDAVDSAKGPEMQGDNLSPQSRQSQRLAVDPGIHIAQFRRPRPERLKFRQVDGRPLQLPPLLALHWRQRPDERLVQVRPPFFDLPV